MLAQPHTGEVKIPVWTSPTDVLGTVKELLVNYFGVPESQLVTAGLGYADDPFVRGQDVDSNGNFVETEGAKNRCVVVLDAESEIALHQILRN